jgi:uncharacterized lipoprotein YbaY
MMTRWMISGLLAVACMVGGCKNSDNAATTPATTTTGASSASGSDANGQTAAGTATGAAGTSMQQQAPPPPPPPPPLVVPAGTTIPVILATTLNSKTSDAGDVFQGSIARPVLVGEEEAIPKGASVEGVVVSAKKQGAIKGEATLSVKLTKIVVHGTPYMVASSTYGETEKGKGKRSAVMTGGGAALGAIIGGIAGGGKGAAIGAGVGGGGGLAASAGTGGKNAELPAESRINFKLTEPITIDRNQAPVSN